MAVFNPNKLHVKFEGDISPTAPLSGRRYTLTHSDQTGDLFLTVGTGFDQEALKDFQTRLMRDEVLAEWREEDEGQLSLHLLCHVSGWGLNFGPAGWRYRIFRSHLSQVLQALRYGDRALYDAHKTLDQAPILIHFNSHRVRYRKVENWGEPADYIV
nr:staygreen family protein [Anaerolineae bacterium]